MPGEIKFLMWYAGDHCINESRKPTAEWGAAAVPQGGPAACQNQPNTDNGGAA